MIVYEDHAGSRLDYGLFEYFTRVNYTRCQTPFGYRNLFDEVIPGIEKQNFEDDDDADDDD